MCFATLSKHAEEQVGAHGTLQRMKGGATGGKIITHDVSEKAFYPHETKELKNLTRYHNYF